MRAILASGKLGQHSGLPASIIATTTLRELEAGAGRALTDAGSLLPMSEVIRLASHAHHYLAIFDKGRAIRLYHTKRLASPGQRIVLYTKDRGCSHPGCDVPGYFTEVHHVREWATCHQTHIDDLTLGCGSHHRLVTPGGWTTRKRRNGDTEWIPPRTWITANPEPIRFITRRNCCATTTKATRENRRVGPGLRHNENERYGPSPRREPSPRSMAAESWR